MIPGYGSTRLKEVTVASAANVILQGDLVRITGTTAIVNLSHPLMLNRDGLLVFIYSVDGVTINASGNVAVSQALAVNRPYAYIFSRKAGKWLPGAIA